MNEELLSTGSLYSNNDEYAKQLKRNLEKQIREELELKYQKSYENTINKIKSDLMESHQITSNFTIQPEVSPKNEAIELVIPTTKIKDVVFSSDFQINESKESNLLLTLHDDLICIWDYHSNEFQLKHQIKLHSKVNMAIFDLQSSDKIYAASDNGYIYSYTLSDYSHTRTQIQLSSLILIYQLSIHSIIAFTVDGDYIILAGNLVDVLSPPLNIFLSHEFKKDYQQSKSKSVLITTCLMINSNNLVIALLSGEVLLVDLANKSISSLYKPTSNPLPAVLLSYNFGKLLILGLDHSINIINISNKIKLVDTLIMSELSFCADWIDHNSIITCSIQNQATIWNIDNNKLKRDKVIDLSTVGIDEKENAILMNKFKPMISMMKMVDGHVIVGDLGGKILSTKIIK